MPKFRDKRTGRVIEAATPEEAKAIFRQPAPRVVEEPPKPSPDTQPEPEQPTSTLGKAWEVANKPLWDAPSRWGRQLSHWLDPGPQSVKEAEDRQKNPYAAVGSFGAGAVEGIGDLVSSLTSPLSLGLTLVTAGEGAAAGRVLQAAKAGKTAVGAARTARVLSAAEKATGLGLQAHGAYNVVEGGSKIYRGQEGGWTQAGGGLAEFAGGGVARHHANTVQARVGPAAKSIPKSSSVTRTPRTAPGTPYPDVAGMADEVLRRKVAAEGQFAPVSDVLDEADWKNYGKDLAKTNDWQKGAGAKSIPKAGEKGAKTAKVKYDPNAPAPPDQVELLRRAGVADNILQGITNKKATQLKNLLGKKIREAEAASKPAATAPAANVDDLASGFEAGANATRKVEAPNPAATTPTPPSPTVEAPPQAESGLPADFDPDRRQWINKPAEAPPTELHNMSPEELIDIAREKAMRGEDTTELEALIKAKQESRGPSQADRKLMEMTNRMRDVRSEAAETVRAETGIDPTARNVEAPPVVREPAPEPPPMSEEAIAERRRLAQEQAAQKAATEAPAATPGETPSYDSIPRLGRSRTVAPEPVVEAPPEDVSHVNPMTEEEARQIAAEAEAATMGRYRDRQVSHQAGDEMLDGTVLSALDAERMNAEAGIPPNPRRPVMPPPRPNNPAGAAAALAKLKGAAPERTVEAPPTAAPEPPKPVVTPDGVIEPNKPKTEEYPNPADEFEPPAEVRAAGEAAAQAESKPKVGRKNPKVAERERIRAKIYTPGNIVQGYGGKDKVLKYNPPDAEGHWSVEVVRVGEDGQPLPGERPRVHGTEPDRAEVVKTIKEEKTAEAKAVEEGKPRLVKPVKMSRDPAKTISQLISRAEPIGDPDFDQSLARLKVLNTKLQNKTITHEEMALMKQLAKGLHDHPGFPDESRMRWDEIMAERKGKGTVAKLIKEETGAVGKGVGELAEEQALEKELKKGGKKRRLNPFRHSTGNPEVDTKFEDWVNARHAGSVESELAARDFRDLDAQGMDVVHKFQSGDRSGRLADIEAFFQKKLKELRDAGINVDEKRNYIRQIWKDDPDKVKAAMRRLGLKPSLSMKSFFETYAAGEAEGLTPKYTKISQIIGDYERMANKAIADRQFFEYLMENKLLKPAGKAPRSWQQIPNFPIRRFRVKTKSGKWKDKGATVYLAPPEVARTINNYLNEPSRVVKWLADKASITKNIALSSGVPFTGINAHGFNIVMRNFMAKGAKGLGQGLAYMVNPKMAANYLDKNLEKAPFFVRHGLSLTSEEHAFGTTGSTGLAKYGQKFLEIQGKMFEDPLFQKIIPALKLEHVQSVYEGLLESGMDEAAAAKQASRTTNNFFGGINWEEMQRDRTFQNIMRMGILAPDWFETTFRMGGGIGRSVASPMAAKNVPYRNAIRNLMAAYLGANLINKQQTGHWMWQNDPGHGFDIEMGTAKGQNGQTKKRYLRVGGTSADFARLPIDVVQGIAKGESAGEVFKVFRNRMSIQASAIANLLENQSSMNQPIYGKDRYGRWIPMKDQALGIGQEIFRPTTPQYVKAPIDYARGKVGAEEAVMGAIESPFRYASKPGQSGGRRRVRTRSRSR